MKYLGFVVARRGSKGIINKNVRLLKGKPLVQYSFESAKTALLLDAVHLSTDDPQIADIACREQIDVLYPRPEHLATDQCSVIDVILYHLQWLEENNRRIPQNIVLLQPTSPIRNKDLIDKCIEAYERSGKKSLIAVSHCSQHPFETFCIENNELVYFNKNATRRQAYPEYYFITGSIYIVSTEFIRNKKKLFDEQSAIYVISSFEAIDIDEEADLLLAEFYLNNQHS